MQTPSAVPEALLSTQPLPGPFIGRGLPLRGDHAGALAQEEKAVQHCTGKAAREMVQSWGGSRQLQGTPLPRHDPRLTRSRGTSLLLCWQWCGTLNLWGWWSGCWPSWGDRVGDSRDCSLSRVFCASRGESWQWGEDAGCPYCARIFLGLQDHLPSDAHTGSVWENEEGTFVCQATTMACIDRQIPARCLFSTLVPWLIGFSWVGFSA